MSYEKFYRTIEPDGSLSWTAYKLESILGSKDFRMIKVGLFEREDGVRFVEGFFLTHEDLARRREQEAHRALSRDYVESGINKKRDNW